MVREGLFQTVYLSLGYPAGRPRGVEAQLWANFRRLVGPQLAVRVAGGDVQPEEALLPLLQTSFFLRLPRWTDPARAAFRHLEEEVEIAEPDLWRRRFISDCAGLERVAPRMLVLSARLWENYRRLLEEPPEEEPHEEYPVMMRAGLPRGPLGPWEEEVAWAVWEETGAEPSGELARALGAEAEVALQPLQGAPPEVLRAALLDLVHFLGVPRLPKSKQGVVSQITGEGVHLLLTL